MSDFVAAFFMMIFLCAGLLVLWLASILNSVTLVFIGLAIIAISTKGAKG